MKIKLTLILILGSFLNIFSQINEDFIKVNFLLYVDSVQLPADDYILIIKINDEPSNYFLTSENFAMHLEYNKKYSFSFYGVGLGKKTFDIHTYAPKRDWNLLCRIYLFSHSPDEYCGYLKYDKVSNYFIKIE